MYICYVIIQSLLTRYLNLWPCTHSRQYTVSVCTPHATLPYLNIVWAKIPHSLGNHIPLCSLLCIAYPPVCRVPLHMPSHPLYILSPVHPFPSTSYLLYISSPVHPILYTSHPLYIPSLVHPISCTSLPLYTLSSIHPIPCISFPLYILSLYIPSPVHPFPIHCFLLYNTLLVHFYDVIPDPSVQCINVPCTPYSHVNYPKNITCSIPSKHSLFLYRVNN